MNKKDLAALRRRFAPEKNDITIIRGCFVNEKGEIVSTFSKSPISLPESEAEHYLASFKKTLGGAVGRNQFTLPVHTDDAALLRQLQSTELTDDAAVNALFNTIREKMEFEGSYLMDAATELTLDFAVLECISSAGLRLLLFARKTMNKMRTTFSMDFMMCRQCICR